ncbi:MAG: alkaline phosphatase D family protein [Myxococcota bacterium]
MAPEHRPGPAADAASPSTVEATSPLSPPSSSEQTSAPLVEPSSGLTRRQLLQGGVLSGAALLTAAVEARTHARTSATDDVGVASGDPRADSVVIWTRVPSGNQSSSVVVSWQVATAQDFATGSVVKSGTFTTDASRDFTVKVKVTGLQPYTHYFYRFSTTTGYASEVGRTLTAPLPTDSSVVPRFAFVSCQKYTSGYYNVFTTLATEDVDFCIHLGDCIYESGGSDVRVDTIGEVQAGRAITLNDFRNKYKLYLSDPEYRKVRALHPWICVWDDHEVFNDYAGGDPSMSQADRDIQSAGYQAYSEFMPLEPDLPFSKSNGITQYQIYRSFQYGALLDVIAVDTRQYRDAAVCRRDVATPGCDDLYAEDRTLMGVTQRDWVLNTLSRSTARWKVLANQVMMMALKLSNGALGFRPNGGVIQTYDGYYINGDQWDGFPAERTLLLEHVEQQKISNFVVITGDIHNCYAGLLRSDFTNRKAPYSGVELVTGSVTSSGIGDSTGAWNPTSAYAAALAPANPHLTWVDAKYHNYTLMECKQEGLNVRYVSVSTIKNTTYTPSVLARFYIPDGISTLIPGEI